MLVKLYLRLGCFFLFTFIKVIYDCLRNIFWHFTGVRQRIQSNKRKQPLNHEIAQVETILFRYKADVIGQPPGQENFITVHSKFVDPDYILLPKVTLYGVNDKEAIFVETEENIDAYCIDKSGAFFMAAQFKYAKKIIKMPLWAFFEVAEKIGKPKKKILFVFMTTRCGSTLLMQILEKTKKCLVISEPGTLGSAFVVGLNHEQKDLLFKCVINVLCKPVKENIEMYVVKFAPLANGNIPYTYNLFPESQQLFMYRNGQDVLKSCCKTTAVSPMACVFNWSLSLSPSTTKELAACLAVEDMYGKIKNKKYSYHDMYTIIWAACIRLYLELRRNGLAVSAIRYEDMVKDTDFAMKEVFKYIGLEYNNEVVEKEFGQDSQRNTNFSHGNLKKNKPFMSVNFGSDIQTSCSQISDIFEVPSVIGDILLPGTITSRQASNDF